MQNLFLKLKELIKKYDKFVIMGHSNPDLDSIGSSFGLFSILKSMNKNCYVFLDLSNILDYNKTVINAIENIKGKIDFVDCNNYKDIIDEKTLLIILDVHQQDRLEYNKILDDNIDIIIIDHHMKTNNYIENTIMTYIDTSLSSMTEFVVYLAKDLNVQFDQIIATIMLAGIEIDTNSYNLRTTNKTYLASSILMEMGADPIFKQELLKETIDEYVNRANIIKSGFTINGTNAMCLIPGINAKESLAEVAEELLKFVDIEASFAIGKISPNTVGVSARSIGKLNVEAIIKQIGGGGTDTNAAAQIQNKSVKEVKQEIIKTLE